MTISPMIIATRRFTDDTGLPETGNEAVSHPGHVCLPSRIVGQCPLLGLDTVQERYPSRQHQHNGAGIPLLQVVADVAQHVGEKNRMTHESIRASRLEPPQRGANPESTAETEEARKTQTRCQRDEDESAVGPR